MSGSTPGAIRAAARMLSAVSHPGIIRSYFPYWDTKVRPFLLLAVDALPCEQFDFKPRAEMLTARQLVVHIAEAEYGWMGNAVAGEPYEEWVVPAESSAEGWTLAIEAPLPVTVRLLPAVTLPTAREPAVALPAFVCCQPPFQLRQPGRHGRIRFAYSPRPARLDPKLKQ